MPPASRLHSPQTRMSSHFGIRKRLRAFLPLYVISQLSNAQQ